MSPPEPVPRDAPGSVLLDSNAGPLLFAAGSSVARSVARGGVHDPGVEFLMRKYRAHLFPFFDVGANVGLFSILAAQLGDGSETIVAFEPERHNLELLEANLRRSGASCVRVEPFACARRDGALEMGPIDCGLSTRSGGRLPVPARSLASYIGERGLRPGFVKLDIEGAELDALEGLAPAPDSERIILELEFSWRDHRGHVGRFLELRPPEAFDWEFLLSERERAWMLAAGPPGERCASLRDERTGATLLAVVARGSAELRAILRVLARSTRRRASRKWELCITPRDLTIPTLAAAVPGFRALPAAAPPDGA